MSHKAGYVTIIGKPNAGKSTLMNALIGEKISIATNKPQTTRKRIVGILSDENFQIIFLDTPGILNPEYLMQKKMLEYVFSSAKDGDIILFLLDVKDDPTSNRTFNDPNTIEILAQSRGKKILLLNKVDLAQQNDVEVLIKSVEEKNIFERIIPISASENYNLESVKAAILEYLPEHPKYYPDDQLSDENERFFVSEIIRENIFELYRDEIPYSTEVVIEEFNEREGRKDFIRALIYVERESQKPIIIGAKGEAIKRLGQSSRRSIEQFLQREVYLELNVKVKEKWRSDDLMLKRFGYNSGNE